MIALDTNFIVALLVNSHANHKSVLKWFNQQSDTFATTHINVGEVLRLLSHPKVFAKPLKLSVAVALVNTFIEDFGLELLVESEDWLSDLGELCTSISSLKGSEVFDARIALCLQHHGVSKLATFDRDFAKYSFLKVFSLIS